MNTLRKTLLIGATALGLAAGALSAHADEGRHGYAANQEQMQAKMAERMAKHQAKLHDLLKLTAAQEPAWTAFVASMKPGDAAMGSHPDRAAIAAMSAPERLQAAIDRAKTHEAAMETHLAALKTFYGQLTPDQQKVFNDNVMGGAHGPRLGMMMHHQG